VHARDGLVTEWNAQYRALKPVLSAIIPLLRQVTEWNAQYRALKLKRLTSKAQGLVVTEWNAQYRALKLGALAGPPGSGAGYRVECPVQGVETTP